MARRLPSQPPVLAGFSFVRVLGSGGFADVFLYEQNSPRRQVAVKVMLAEYVNNTVRALFEAEADVMAQLSAHPAILTVYQSGVAADGRPYLVMEYCSAELGHAYREHPLPPAEVLRIGIKIASALETAHRSGVLHRDIKPSNILVTAYGNPVLSDFGIAGRVGETELDEELGMSIPWSSPEVLNNSTNGTVQSEVWALGATLYSLVAGRSPFEIPTSGNTSADLMSRISRGKPQPISRGGVPEQLETVLLRAMAKRPEARPQSAIEFVRTLQSVELSLGYAPTQPDIPLSDWASAVTHDEDDQTRVTGVRSIDPGRRRRRASDRPAAARESTRGTRERVGGPTPLSASSGPGARKPRGAAFLALLTTTAVLVVALAVTTVIVVTQISRGETIPRVTDVSGEIATGNTVEFRWGDPGVSDTDSYQIETRDGSSSTQRSTQFRVTGEAGGSVCVTVSVNRAGTLGEPSGEKCVDVPTAGASE